MSTKWGPRFELREVAITRPRRVASVLLGLACSSVVIGCASEQDAAPAPCERLRQHMVTLQTSNVPPPDRPAHRDALTASLGERFLDSCQRLPSSQVRCALAAADSASLASCSSR